jgi:hypothetical protein
MSKLSILVAGAAGYVLGARAGRERYDQIVALTQRVWSDPRVQRQTSAAADAVKEKAPDVGAAIADAARTTAAKTAAKVTGGGDDSSAERTRDENGRFSGG